MTAIPIVVVEEHHEAFLVWHLARLAGMIEPRGNHLLHVDFHSDLAPPVLCGSIHDLEPSPDAIAGFTYRELTIGTFIVPAVYQRLVNRVYWLAPAARGASPAGQMYVRTYKGEGRLFLLAQGSPKTVTALLGDSVAFDVVQASADDTLEPGGPVILDVDLDYFSLDAYPSREFRVAVTADEYARFVADPYHPLRASMGCRGEQAGADYFIEFNRLAGRDVPAPLKASPDVIRARAAGLAACLRRSGIQPRLIDICRSCRTGYTPADQVAFIEEVLLDTLGELYELTFPPGLRTRASARASGGAPATLPSPRQ